MPNSEEPHANSRWSNTKIAFLLFLPSLIFIICGMAALETSRDEFAYISVYGTPVLALILAVLTTREVARDYRRDYERDFNDLGAYIGFGIIWILAHAGVLIFVGFGGCMLIAGSMGWNMN